MAETKDKLATLSQVKRYVESVAWGGASIELLWSGNSTTNPQPVPGVSGYDFAIAKVGNSVYGSVAHVAYAMFAPGESYSFVSGDFGASSSGDNVYYSAPNNSPVLYEVYGFTVEQEQQDGQPIVVFQGPTGVGEPVTLNDAYAECTRLEIECHEAMGGRQYTETLTAPYYDDMESTPNGFYTINTPSGVIDVIVTGHMLIIDKVTGYK